MATALPSSENYVAVIGLEVHAQLQTASKIFSPDDVGFGKEPNTSVHVISLAHPGTLPKLNLKAVEFAIKMGIACHSEIASSMFFDRKNYFYPDLPKGYQITQDRAPVCKGGRIKIRIASHEKEIPLNRIHLEEDAGKSLHEGDPHDSLIDLNRAGTPLIEIVTEPSISSAEEAAAVLTEIRKLVRYLEICDGNMEEGSLRCDANVSIMPRGATTFGKKVEIKNMNSIKHVQKAIEHEISRQVSERLKGNEIFSETRTYDVSRGNSFSLREKEELNDYRYFPDPDLSPVVITNEWLSKIRMSMPMLPEEVKRNLIVVYSLPDYDAEVISETKALSAYFESICKHTKNYKAASNWVMGPVKSLLNARNIDADALTIHSERIADMINDIDNGKYSYTVASQSIFPLLETDQVSKPLELAQRLNLLQESNVDILEPLIDQVIKEFPLKVEEYKNGKKGIITMFMGEVMKRSKGKADPKLATELLTKKLNK